MPWKNSEGKPCSGVRGDQQVSTDRRGNCALPFPGRGLGWQPQRSPFAKQRRGLGDNVPRLGVWGMKSPNVSLNREAIKEKKQSGSEALPDGRIPHRFCCTHSGMIALVSAEESLWRKAASPVQATSSCVGATVIVAFGSAPVCGLRKDDSCWGYVGGLPPKPLPEGYYPSDSLPRFAAA